MHCAVQLSAFLYRAMYSTMQQPLTRTAALKKMINRLSFEWYAEASAMNIHILLINTTWIHSSFTIHVHVLKKLCLPFPTVQYHNASMPDTYLNLLKEAGDQIFKR